MDLGAAGLGAAVLSAAGEVAAGLGAADRGVRAERDPFVAQENSPTAPPLGPPSGPEDPPLSPLSPLSLSMGDSGAAGRAAGAVYGELEKMPRLVARGSVRESKVRRIYLWDILELWLKYPAIFLEIYTSVSVRSFFRHP